MFNKSIYVSRRDMLKKNIPSGIVVFFGNDDVLNSFPGYFNSYPSNTYNFRQDSNFLYFCGLRRPGLALAMDVDSGKDILFAEPATGNVVLDGPQPSLAELAASTGIETVKPFEDLKKLFYNAKANSQTVHFLPQVRYDIKIKLAELQGCSVQNVNDSASQVLMKQVVDMRSVKRPEEMTELNKAAEISYAMQLSIMNQLYLSKGVLSEKHMAGVIDGIASSYAGGIAFQTILTVHGEIQHAHPSEHVPANGELLLVNAGAQSMGNYCTDITRTLPVSGKFTEQQASVYNAVLAAHDYIIANAKPEVKWIDLHLGAVRIITEKLIELGLMKGNVNDAVAAGAYSLFMPHGIGHMIGLDVHDIESIARQNVGFDAETLVPNQFGLETLRHGKRLKEGNVMTVEPGIYFIPELIDEWKAKGICSDFIDFKALEAYRNFGGIRLGDNIKITDKSCELIGNSIAPLKLEDVEKAIKLTINLF